MAKKDRRKKQDSSSPFGFDVCTVFENHPKSLIQNCERSELRLHLEWTKVDLKCQKWRVIENLNMRSNSVTRQVTFNRTKIGENCQN